ncbi:MAG: methylmalonyl-CoA mutase family protein [Ferruginibacter sp.]
MATENQPKLFSAFAPVSKQTWKDTAIADLKGGDFDKQLVWKTMEGIDVQPFYTAEDLQNIPNFRDNTSVKKRRWTNFVEVEVDEDIQANNFILRMIEFGVTGILLTITDPQKTDLNILLKGIDPTSIEIAFKLQKPSPELIQRYFNYLAKLDINLAAVRGFVQSDILEEWSLTGAAPDFKALAAQLTITNAAVNFKGLMLSSHAFVNAGSGIVQECAFLLNKLTDTIEALENEGLQREDIMPQLGIHLAITGEYFLEMAKIRAMRNVLYAVLKCYNIPVPYIPILSSSSIWSKSLYEPTVNMVRNTTEAMSAVLGGCDALLIHPHNSTYQQPDEFSHRIAVNISNLLKEEAYFDKVANPVAGSYYIETITCQLAEKIEQLFRQTETAGGYNKSIRQGLIQQQISVLRQQKEEEIATSKKIYVGTNKYVSSQQPAIVKDTPATVITHEASPLLQPQRATKKFEQLRRATIKNFDQTGKIPTVYLACLGDAAMIHSRTAFAVEFFITAGFEITGLFVFKASKTAAEESATSDADIVVICATDEEYETGVKTFATTFRHLNNRKKLILAGNPGASLQGLQEAGINDCIHQKTNVVDFITALQNELFA